MQHQRGRDRREGVQDGGDAAGHPRLRPRVEDERDDVVQQRHHREGRPRDVELLPAQPHQRIQHRGSDPDTAEHDG